jgi:carbamoylphosphate synthase small subunit
MLTEKLVLETDDWRLMKAILALEDGTVFEGESFGSTGEQYGEVVFNTSMTGYQEILTDPSYKGQIVTMTYPLIGNYGCNDEDFESFRPHVEGFIVREYSSYWSNWRGTKSLDDFLSSYGIIGIQGVDTRALTRRLRSYGVMKGVISTEDLDKESLIAKAKASPSLIGLDLVKYVTCHETYRWEGDEVDVYAGRERRQDGKSPLTPLFQRGDHESIFQRGDHESIFQRGDHESVFQRGDRGSILQRGAHGRISQRGAHGRISQRGEHGGTFQRGDHESVFQRGGRGGIFQGEGTHAGVQLEFDFTRLPAMPRGGSSPFLVVAVDSGIKHNILRKLQSHGCDITVVPAITSAAEILALQPEGVFLANGPGDPEGVPYLVDTVRDLVGKKPIFGICLGHQILGLAFGGRTYKLKFGHRGANQPVKNLITGRVEITTQNHGFCVDADSLKDQPVRLTHINLNDNTLEGMEHEKYPIFSVQYHPEASPGPHDADYLFDKFVNMMREGRSISPLVH